MMRCVKITTRCLFMKAVNKVNNMMRRFRIKIRRLFRGEVNRVNKLLFGERVSINRFLSKVMVVAACVFILLLAVNLMSIFGLFDDEQPEDVDNKTLSVIISPAKESGGEDLSARLGAFGDFLGGTLNPVFTFLTFMVLLITVSLQRKDSALAKENFQRQNSLAIISSCIDISSKKAKALQVDPVYLREYVFLEGEIPGEKDNHYLVRRLRLIGFYDSQPIFGEAVFELLSLILTRTNFQNPNKIISDALNVVVDNEDARVSILDFSLLGLGKLTIFRPRMDYSCGVIADKVINVARQNNISLDEDKVLKAISICYSNDVEESLVKVCQMYKRLVRSDLSMFYSYFRSISNTMLEIQASVDCWSISRAFISRMQTEEIIFIILEACIGTSNVQGDLLSSIKKLKVLEFVSLEVDCPGRTIKVDGFPLYGKLVEDLLDFDESGRVVGLGAFGGSQNIDCKTIDRIFNG